MANKSPPKLTLEEIKLVEAYKKAQQNLIDIIAQKEAKGNITTYQKSLLNQVNAELSKLDSFSSAWVKNQVTKEYYKSAEEVNKFFKDLKVELPNANVFSKLNTSAVEMLVKNSTGDLLDANQYIGRQISDQIRQVSIDATTQKFAQGLTVKELKRQLINKLIDTGINGIKDKRGRLISLDAYASVVARSTTAEATNRATINQLTENGYDLVKMTSHNTTCKLCAPLQGRVYSISGKDERFPKLNIAFVGNYANIHPNCKHRLAPYIEKFNDVEKDIENSNKPFDVDPRSKAEIEAYNNSQKLKQQLRNDKQQWEKYKLALPNEAPKTLSGFRKMKNANSENFQNLESKFNLQNNLRNDIIKDISFDANIELSKIHNDLLQHGRLNGTEMVKGLDLNTLKEIPHKLVGTNNQVVFTQELSEYLNNAKKDSLILSHNHPSSSAFSQADLNILIKYPSLKSITVIGHNETIYSLSIGNGQRPISIVQKYEDIKYKNYDTYVIKVLNKELTNTQAGYLHSNEIMTDLSKELGWDYRRIEKNE
jgi:hypothetical protein